MERNLKSYHTELRKLAADSSPQKTARMADPQDLVARAETRAEIAERRTQLAAGADDEAYPARRDAPIIRLITVLREYLDALDRGHFNFRPGFHCGMCDYRDCSCMSWCP